MHVTHQAPHHHMRFGMEYIISMTKPFWMLSGYDTLSHTANRFVAAPLADGLSSFQRRNQFGTRWR
jgi:hypothetical protein